MNIQRDNILFYLSVVFAIFLFYSKSTFLAYSFALLIFIYSFINIKLGIMTWAVITPISGGLEGELYFFIYTPTVVFMYFMLLIFSKEKIYKTNFHLLLISLLIFIILGTIFSGFYEYFHVIIYVTLLFAMVFLISQIIIKDINTFYYLANGLIGAALIATISSYFLSEQDSIRRLALGDSIRQLANIIGAGILLLFILYFDKRNTYNSSFLPLNKLKWLILIFLLFGLIFTMSRGVILALMVSTIIFFGHILYRNRLKIKSIVMKILLVFLVLFLLKIYGSHYISHLGLNVDLLSERFSDESVQGGTSSRNAIWLAGISGLEGLNILFGSGLSSFRMLALKKGYDYYSHSVFVDTFVTVGILGSVFYFYFLFYQCYYTIKFKSFSIASILIFVFLSYLTHGTIKSMGFWILISICVGLIEFKMRHKAKHENIDTCSVVSKANH